MIWSGKSSRTLMKCNKALVLKSEKIIFNVPSHFLCFTRIFLWDVWDLHHWPVLVAVCSQSQEVRIEIIFVFAHKDKFFLSLLAKTKIIFVFVCKDKNFFYPCFLNSADSITHTTSELPFSLRPKGTRSVTQTAVVLKSADIFICKYFFM